MRQSIKSSPYSELEHLLMHYWGYASFRDQQRQIIQSVLAGHDTLGLMATGMGKSLCYQILPIYAQEVEQEFAVCVVISPLVALMHEQVASFNLRLATKLGWQASYVAHGHSDHNLWSNLATGQLRLIYLSPERISLSYYLEQLQRLPVRYICVDEAHCALTWGQDFRPAYLNLVALREFFPRAIWLALSATIPVNSYQHLLNSLGLEQAKICGGNFQNKNLSFQVRETTDKLQFLRDFLRKATLCSSNPQSGIIYANSRQRVEELSRELKVAGLAVEAYHAGLENVERKFLQKQWVEANGQYPIRVLVSTNALGMGIDKRDTRFVLHDSPARNLLDYYQEAGRAGRDGLAAQAILLYDAQDLALLHNRAYYDLPTTARLIRSYQAFLAYFAINPYTPMPQRYSFVSADFLQVYSDLFQGTTEAEKMQQLLRHLYIFERLRLLSRTNQAIDTCYVRLRTFENDFLVQQTIGNYWLEETMELILRRFPPDSDILGTRINITQLASLLSVSETKTRAILQELAQRGLLELFWQTGTVGISLELRYNTTDWSKESRMQDELRRLTSEIYQTRLDMINLDMINYITNPPPCRSAYLAQYFSQTESYLCGICDRCLAN